LLFFVPDVCRRDQGLYSVAFIVPEPALNQLSSFPLDEHVREVFAAQSIARSIILHAGSSVKATGNTSLLVSTGNVKPLLQAKSANILNFLGILYEIAMQLLISMAKIMKPSVDADPGRSCP
jgi:hypothetical protein